MRVVLLDFDGTCYRGDLPVQAYARQVAELLDPRDATTVIAAMRAFLEGRPAPEGAPPEFHTAEDGYELVHAMADGYGIATDRRRAAYRRSRDDLARSAFVLDPEPGLAEWLAMLQRDPSAEVWLVTMSPENGVREVLDALDLTPLVTRILAGTRKPAGLAEIAAEALRCVEAPHDVLAIGDRWAADLAPVHDLGGRTAHLDRYGRSLGTPTWRAVEFPGLLPGLDAWADSSDRLDHAI